MHRRLLNLVAALVLVVAWYGVVLAATSRVYLPLIQSSVPPTPTATETPTATASPSPTPRSAVTPTATKPCANIPPPRFASIQPNCVRYGQSFYVEATNFEAFEQVDFWITDQGGLTVGTVERLSADANGKIGGTIDTTDYFGYELHAGNYVFIAQDAARKFEPSTAPFRVIP